MNIIEHKRSAHIFIELNILGKKKSGEKIYITHRLADLAELIHTEFMRGLSWQIKLHMKIAMVLEKNAREFLGIIFNS